MEIDLKLPVGLTDDMFPLALNIEIDKMSLSPDATQNTLPVEVGASIIPGNASAKTFHFIKTFETREEYDNLPTVGTQKILTTYWITNVVNNEATVWVTNKYFNDASDNFVNAKSFVSLTLNNGNTVREGAGRTVSATLVLPESDNSYASRNIQIKLEGLSYNGSTEPFYLPSPTSRTITINDLVTTDANSTLKITAEEDSYAEISASVGRRRSYFTTEGANLGFSKASLGTAADETVNFSFTLSDYEPGMTVTVALDGFVPADDTELVSAATRAVTNYVFSPESANCTIHLKTTEGAKTCTVQLKADYYDDSEIATIEQADIKNYSGTLSVTVNNINIQHNQNNQNPTPTITIKSLTVNGADNIVKGTVTNIEHTATKGGGTGPGAGNKYTLNSASFDIENILISGSSLTDNTTITLVVTIKYGSTTKDFTINNIKLSSIK